MNKIREYLITTGISLVFALSVGVAWAQAPAEPAEARAPAEPAEAAAPAEPAEARAPAGQPASLKERLERNRALRAAGTRSRSPVARQPAASAAPSAEVTPATPGVRTISPSSSRLAQDAAASVISPETAAAGKDASATTALKFDNTAADIVLMAYAEQTGKTLLIAPDVPKANITLRSQPNVALTADEYIEAIEVVLSMNGIVLEPFGEKFIKVLARKTVRTDGIKILMEPPREGHPEKSRIVSQMIQLINITIDEAKKAIEGFKKPDGMIQSFERTNSLLVTDTQENINRMLEIIKFIDQPIPVTEEVFTRTINFAKADEIKKRLEEIVAESQKASSSKTEVKSKSSGSPGITKSTSASTISARLAQLRRRGGKPEPTPEDSPNVAIDALVSDADRGMIRGKVQIMADERTNQLIIITRKENMNFFEKIINVLDVETTPDVKVEVLRLEYADAEEVSTMLNDLIGNASSKKDDANTSAKSGAATATKSKSLTTAAKARESAAPSSTSGEPGKSKLGQLSKDNIKILADKRTNAIVMMGSLGDLAAITEIINSMDIMLSQVLIETVVLEVALKDEIETGINWVRRVNNSDSFRYTVGGGGTSKGGATSLFGDKTSESVDSGGKDEDGNPIMENITTESIMPGDHLEAMSNPLNGIEYFMTLKNLRLDAVVQAAQSDSRSRVLSSPILLTVDNKEAAIEATETRYMYKGMRYMGYSSAAGGGGSYEPDIEQRDVGLTVKVTPRINPEGNVIMTIEETFEDVLGEQVIDGQAWPTVTSRKLSADVSVGNGETVILGGLVKNSKSNSESGIPILKDIPVVGKYLFGSVKKGEIRSELLVFLTPYVINSDEDMRREARRRKDYLDATDVWTKGWSDSDLADPVPTAEMKLRLARKKAMETRWKKYADELEAHGQIDQKIAKEREKALRILSDNASGTNAVPPKAGVMKVEERSGSLDEDVTVEQPLLEDASIEPQRPQVETEKRSWWGRLFSSD